MKNLFNKILALLLAVIVVFGVVGCGDTTGGGGGDDDEIVDYVSQLKLDMNSSTKKAEATVKAFIDGDTTHFYVSGLPTGGVLKARYLAIDTPESTGKIEEWGKKASNFTHSKLESAVSIIVESDDENWNLDSTGGRHLVWVWYKPDANSEYRNLNLEILQNGLCRASATASNRYGETCMAALNQAKALKLDVHSNTPDPDFPRGEAAELTLSELRPNIEEYSNKKVAFEGVITREENNGVYIEEYDPETDRYYGIYVYYGASFSGPGKMILGIGNRVRIVGSVQYYESGKSYQVSGLKYNMMKPDDPDNIKKISEGNEPSYALTSVPAFNSKVDLVLSDETTKTFDYADLALATTVRMENLTVKSIYTTTNPDSSSVGAMTLTCEDEDGNTVDVRTAVFRDASGALITAEAYMGKTINVQGIVDNYGDEYQVFTITPADITILQ